MHLTACDCRDYTCGESYLIIAPTHKEKGSLLPLNLRAQEKIWLEYQMDPLITLWTASPMIS